ncbi:hypothetical protein [Streptomyces sp. NPDC004267]|uniref:hypothetical protein n=1 Tax=Streptomyces sp. NPDC004267 TaxID=3364694 RepID=UPI0036CC0BB9
MPTKSISRGTGEGLPPGRRQLAGAIAELYRHLGAGTLSEVASLLATMNWRKDPSELSRYRNGRRKPPLRFVVLLHALAVENAGPDKVGLSLHELRRMHAAAEPTFCRSCTPLREENNRLRSEIGRLSTEQEVTRLGHAGSTAELPPAPSLGSTPLPVPPSAGDRQRSARDMSAAQQVAATATRFHERGETGHAVSWLQDAAASLTPAESATAIALLRRQEARLADTAINIHGRTRLDKDVILIALELMELGMVADAGSILRAAVS